MAIVTCTDCDTDYHDEDERECPMCGCEYASHNCDKHKIWWNDERHTMCPYCEKEQDDQGQ
jgi:hypothetical protein